VKALYVTDRAAIGDDRFGGLLAALCGAPGLSVQLREKNSTDAVCLGWARRAREALGRTVPLYVNRRFDVAWAAGADGVHLPSDGLPFSPVRAATPRGFRVGLSTHSPDGARRAIDEGVDLIVIGPIFETPSKTAFGEPIGPEALAGLPRRDEHGRDVFAIGGIDERRLSALLPYRDRISGVAAIRLFQESADPRGVVDRIMAA
jgi:thiamine-phosphate pyrophosphorylase